MYSIRETFVFQTEIYRFCIFIRNLCCFSFLSSPRGSVCYFFPLCFSSRRARGLAVVKVNDPLRSFPDWELPFSLVVKNSYDLKSQIRFWFLPKNAALILIVFHLRSNMRVNVFFWSPGRAKMKHSIIYHRLIWDWNHDNVTARVRVVPHFSSGIVERAKREREWKSPHARKGDTRRGERKMRDYRQSLSIWFYWMPLDWVCT